MTTILSVNLVTTILSVNLVTTVLSVNFVGKLNAFVSIICR